MKKWTLLVDRSLFDSHYTAKKAPLVRAFYNNHFTLFFKSLIFSTYFNLFLKSPKFVSNFLHKIIQIFVYELLYPLKLYLRKFMILASFNKNKNVKLNLLTEISHFFRLKFQFLNAEMIPVFSIDQ